MANTVTIGKRAVSVRELTVKEQRDWLKSLSDKDRMKGEANDLLVGHNLFEDVSLDDLALMSDLTLDEMQDLKPSEITPLYDECKRVNSHFFGLRERVLVSLRVKP